MNIHLDLAARHADNIIRLLAGFDIKPPAGLVAALDVHRELSLTVSDPGSPRPLVTGVTVTQARKAIDKWLDAKARYDIHKTHAGEINDAVNRAVLASLRADRDNIIEACRPAFTEHAATFTEHFRQLPAAWADTEAMLRAGSQAVAHYEAALHVVPQLDQLAEIRNSLPEAGIVGHVAQAVEYADIPETVDVEAFGQSLRSATTPLGRWGATLATHPDTRLVWRSVTEHKQAIAAVEAWTIHTERHHLGAGIHGISQARKPTPSHPTTALNVRRVSVVN